MSKLTAKQQAWVDYYKQGKTAAEAARLAGYKARDDNGFQSIGSENLRKLAVYIAERDKILETPRIADMEEINAFWTNIMRDKSEETKERLKASELRAKAAGAFIQQIKLDNIPVVISGGDELEDCQADPAPAGDRRARLRHVLELQRPLSRVQGQSCQQEEQDDRAQPDRPHHGVPGSQSAGRPQDVPHAEGLLLCRAQVGDSPAGR